MALRQAVLALLVLRTVGVVIRRKGNETVKQTPGVQDYTIPVSPDFFLIDIPGLGLVQGREAVDGPVGVFLGVPYAEPPLGHQRWRSPTPKKPWDGIINVTGFAPVCPQFPSPANLSSSMGAYTVAESCLIINIYAPMASLLPGSPKLPVMVFIPGDGFVGDSPDSTKAGRTVVATNNTVIVVEMAYRLNVFGFLASPELQARNQGMGVNFGLQDQQEALRFIQNYITAFGGNPEQVMIFGISSGGAAVMDHLVMPNSAGLFSSALIQSGFYAEMMVDYNLATKNYYALLEKVGCSDIACLEKLPAHTLVHNGWELTGGQVVYSPVIDNVTLSGLPWNLIAEGAFHKEVGIMIGTARDEVSGFMLLNLTDYPVTLTEWQFDVLLAELYPLFTPTQTAEIKGAYTRAAGYDYPEYGYIYSWYWWALMRMRTDDIYGFCSERWLARAFAAGGAPAVWLYVNWEPQDYGKVLIQHGEDLDWIFGPPTTPIEMTMLTYFRNFITTWNPNSPGLVNWPQYEVATNTAFKVILDGFEPLPNYRYDACQFWDSYHAVNGFTTKLFPNIKPVANPATDPISVGYEAGGPYWFIQ